jgi:PTS system nitrogen regulatory IIA component
MEIQDFLSSEDVIIDIRAPDKRQLLRDLSKHAAERLGLSVDNIASAILKREELGSTGMGDRVAIPHARIQQLERPFGILARVAKPIAFESIDGEPVDIVFLLLLPAATEGEHLNALACVARQLRNAATKNNLRRASSDAELYRAILT